MHIKMHRPNFVESDEPVKQYDFNSLEELLAIPEVKSWAEGPKFKRFSISIDNPQSWSNLSPQHHLMAEVKDKSFWVVGYLTEDISQLDLPRWVAPSQRKE